MSQLFEKYFCNCSCSISFCRTPTPARRLAHVARSCVSAAALARSQITSTYAEVVWKTLDTVPLPPAIVKRFAGKPMAVVGLEWDQVRRTAAGDVSVPMNVAYNHHYGTTLLGADAELVRVDAGDPRVATTGHPAPVERDGTTVVRHFPAQFPPF